MGALHVFAASEVKNPEMYMCLERIAVWSLVDLQWTGHVTVKMVVLSVGDFQNLHAMCTEML